MSDLDRTHTSPNADDPAATGERVSAELIHRFSVLSELGVGGSGVVYKAYDPDLDRAIALKLLRANQRDSDIGQQRLLREAQAIARLSHPNVVSVYEVGTEGEDVFIAMEFVPGGTLRDWLDERQRSVDEVLRVFRLAGAGLAAAHDKGMVHRDFKPANVLLAEDGTPRVADFGLARVWSSAFGDEHAGKPHGTHEQTGVAETITVAGTIVGTPAYMAPEQFQPGLVDARADQYAFCASLYEALAGSRPFQRNSESLLSKSVDCSVPAIPKDRRVPSWLEGAVRRGLAKHPEDRFASMHELLGAIARRRGSTFRRALTWIAPALFAGGALAFAAVKRPPPPCEGLDEPIANVWSEPKRQSVESAFLKTGLSFAPGAFADAAKSLDRYRQVWSSARVEVCEATRVRGEQSDELLDLRMACLERRRQEFAEFVEVLTEADREVVALAPAASAELVAPAVCDDLSALRAREQVPVEPRLRAQVEGLQGQLARVEALVVAGRFPDVALVPVSAAKETGHEPTIGEALYWQGRIQLARDDRAQGRRSLSHALLAAERGGDDRLRFRVLNALLDTDEGEASSLDYFSRLSEQADAVIARIERSFGDVRRLRIDLTETLARRDFRRGEPADALSRYEQLERARRALLPEDHLDHVKTLRGLGDATARIGKLDDAIEILEKGERLALTIAGAEHPLLLGVWTDLSDAHRRRGTLDDAVRYAKLYLDGARKFYGPTHSKVASALNQLGNAQLEQGRLEQALETYEATLDMQRRIHGPNHRAVGVTTANISLTLTRAGLGEEAEERARQAVAVLDEAIGPTHPLAIKVRSMVGAALVTQNKWIEAVASYRDVVDRFREHHPDHTFQLDSIRGLATALFELDRHDEALPYLEDGLRLSQINQEAPQHLARLELKTSQALYAKGRSKKRAAQLATDAGRRFEEAGLAEEADEAEALLSRVRRDAR